MTKRKPTTPPPKPDIARRARAMFAAIANTVDINDYPRTRDDLVSSVAAELDVPPSTVRRALARKSIAEASGRKPNAKCPTCGQRIPNKQVTP